MMQRNPVKQRLSRLLHSFLQNKPSTILSGPLRGWKWLSESGNHSYWLGTYEKDYVKAFTQYLRPGFVVFDIGAHAGYFTLNASRIVGNEGQVFAFEPLPHNISLLKKHLRLNSCTNVTLFETAVAGTSGRKRFISRNSFMGHLSGKGELEVEVITLDGLMLQKNFVVPHAIKIDVEGHDYWVLKGAEKLIRENRPTLFISTHGKNNRDRVLQLLEDWQYQLTMIGQGSETNADYCAKPMAISSKIEPITI